MTKRAIIFHLPIYILALFGSAILCLAAFRPRGERIFVDLPDGRLEYISLDTSVSLGTIIKELDIASNAQLPVVSAITNRTDVPRQVSYWIYISPAKRTRPGLIFADFIFNCPVCPREDVFDLCRISYAYNENMELIPAANFWRESIELSNYLLSGSSGNK